MKVAVNRDIIRKRDLFLGLVFIISIVAAWIVGTLLAEKDIENYLFTTMPSATSFEAGQENLFTAFNSRNAEKEPIGFVAIDEDYGYGGPLRMAVAIDLDGQISGYALVDHKETYSYYQKVRNKGFLEQFRDKSVDDPLNTSDDLDAVSGATVTSEALAGAVRKAARKVASQKLGLDSPSMETANVIFGGREIVLLILFASGLVVVSSSFRFKKILRWITMISGIIFLGFIYNSSITLSKINSYLMGYFPNIWTDLFWLILVGGLLLTTLLLNKNPYCSAFCPFGSAQECIGAIGHAKSVSDKGLRKTGLLIKRVLVWTAIIMALLFRNSSIAGYEIFGGLFALTGTAFQFILLITILLASLFIKRPWCTFLCPVDPVVEFIKSFRQLLVNIWKRKQKNVSSV